MKLQENIETLVKLALEEDLGDAGDVTTLATIGPDVATSAQIVTKAEGVIAGLPALLSVYQQVDSSLSIALHVEDAQFLSSGTAVASLEGSARSLLTGERTALNFLQRLSGIATLTHQFVEAVRGTQARILDTRKTTPGWRLLEKYAVEMGGGMNHRMGLYDQVLIKDNHIAAAGGLQAAITQVRQHAIARELPMIVEVETLDQLQQALEFSPDRILLDNMDDTTMRQAVDITAGRVPLEASGNMSLERVAAVAASGVDYISIGALTHSAPALDLSMRIQISERNAIYGNH